MTISNRIIKQITDLLYMDSVELTGETLRFWLNECEAFGSNVYIYWGSFSAEQLETVL